MNSLLEKYNEYKKLENNVLNYTLENGDVISVIFKIENFPHLIGLHKLKDIYTVQHWIDKNNKIMNTKKILKLIEKEKLTDSDIKKSIHYSSIEERYNSFDYNNIISTVYSNVIINFNGRIINSKLNSEYIIFEKGKYGNKHICIGKDKIKGYFYFETYFFEKTDKYILGQKVLKINKISLCDDKGGVLIEDDFI